MFQHQFHIVNRSQLPFLASGFAFLFTSTIVFYLHTPTSNFIANWDNFILQISIVALTFITLSWFIMIIFESGQGYHTLLVQKGLRYGFWLFLVSEGMLFFSFFWAYFHYSLNPSIVMGHQWPAEIGIQKLNPYTIPLLNTVLLLSSGWTATISHRSIMTTDWIWNPIRKFKYYLALLSTIILGYVFLTCQGIEYAFGLQQSWMSNVYWSIFFLLTGFHGLHVIIGTLFLQFNYARSYILSHNLVLWKNLFKVINKFFESYFRVHTFIYKQISRTEIKNNPNAWKRLVIGLIRMKIQTLTEVLIFQKSRSALIIPQLSRYNLATSQHLGLEAALYYWHFVDAIWILLYMVVYLWGR